ARTSAVAPYAPIEWSRMISSARSRVRAPSASAVSASASRCSAPVRAAATATPSTAASVLPREGASTSAVSPIAAPTPAPTSGKSAPPRATSRTSSATNRPTGTRVRNATAPARPRASVLTTRIGDACVVEGRHLAQDRDRGLQDRQCERRTRTFAQPQAQVEQRLEPERVEHERVTGLRAAMRSDESRADRRLTAHGGEHSGRGDEAVDEDDHVARCAAGRKPGEKGDLEAAEGRERIAAGVGGERAPHHVDFPSDTRRVEACPGAADEPRVD